MTILASPESSCLLLINPLVKNCRGLPNDQSAYTTTQFSVLEAASNIISVPRYFSVSYTEEKSQKWLSRPCEKSSSKIYDFPEDKTPWSNLNLVEAIKAEKRERLFICGFWLDSTVSATALDAYVDGFDVHLVSDIAPARNTIQGKSALERLLQIGVVPISTQQLLYEWMTKTPNKRDRENLHQLIENSP